MAALVEGKGGRRALAPVALQTSSCSAPQDLLTLPYHSAI
jgi:hypothetical protein